MYTGTTGDVFCEYSVKRKKGLSEFIKSIAAIVVGIILSGIIFLLFPPFLCSLIVIWPLVYFIIRMQNVEYEYSFTSGELDIDQLTGELNRKRKLTISMNEVDYIAPVGAYELDQYKQGQAVRLKFSANDASKKDYMLLGNVEGRHVEMIFTPNDRFVEAIYNYSPRKVKKA